MLEPGIGACPLNPPDGAESFVTEYNLGALTILSIRALIYTFKMFQI